MKSLISKVLVFTLAFNAASFGYLPRASASLSDLDRSLTNAQNRLTNPGFEASTAGWTASTSAHLATTSTAAMSGKASAVWSPTGSGETLASGYISITSGDGLSGQSGGATCRVKWLSGATQITVEAFDGTNHLGANTVTLPVNPTRISASDFSFPVSGVTRLQFVSTGAGSYVVDDCYGGHAEGIPGGPVKGLAGSNPIQYPMVITADTTAPTLGATSKNLAWYERVGNKAHLHYELLMTSAGTAGSGNYHFSIPSGLNIDTSLVHSGAGGGTLGVVGSSGLSCNGTPATGTVTVADSTSLLVAYNTGTGNVNTLGSGSCPFSNATIRVTFDAFVPIAGWDANVSMASSSTFKVSSYLVNGTRVTTTPSKLGEYRTFFKSVNSSTGTDGAPTTAPNVADGMKLLSVPYASAGATDPNRWEIFVGKNKNVKTEWYASTGRSGSVDVSTYLSSNSTFQVGASALYDPATGIVTVDAMYQDNSSVAIRRIGAATGASGAALGTNAAAWFDITVSENALAVGMDSRQVVSNQSNIKLVGAQITCGTSGSAINSQTTGDGGGWLLSVSNGGSTGCCTLNYTGAFSAAPPLSGCTNTSSGTGSCGFTTVPGVNSVPVCGTSPAGTLANGTLSVWFAGPR